MPEEPPQPKVPQTLQEFEGSEKIVNPPCDDKILDIPCQKWPATGKKCLVIFPTKNEDKVQAFKANFENRKPDDINACFFLRIAVPDDGCSQPCNGQGCVRARSRILKAMEIFRTRKDYETYLEDNGIGQIIVATIESFFVTDGVPRPVDAAVVGMFNVLTGKTVTETSKGVTLNKWFLEEAKKSGGLVDGNEDCLCMTAGEIVAREFPGVNKADWHKFAVGISRGQILKETASGMKIPWGGYGTSRDEC
ncbi:hypothetical protein FOPG_18403 [Fusarium oxysporum f. sp. conglutinans race 2 54008]|uniref:Uncharacterized protein n=1 Tax=Fusarium oxysporum f. sp. conglutinans race 2 54008 TaxID=1089457 RepID=X0GPZ3_FUSOX|nr:hypothetical protein FOPG_18403 [Fusarium oxysporum f. sp. conglutinans race 2 54008]